LLSGATGAAFWALTLGLCAALTVGTLRRRPWAWWVAVTGTVAAAISSVLTLPRVPPEDLFELMAIPFDQRQLMAMVWPREPWAHVVVWLAVWGSLLAYLVAVRPFFDPPVGRGDSSPGVARARG
jgi:hypothetical protein